MLITNLLENISFKKHLIYNIIIRLFLIIFGELCDTLSELRYTDIDYSVVTDGARYILNNESPYKRDTYRYTPILATLLIPNIIIHPIVGKLIFSFFDLFVGIIIEKIVRNECELIFFDTVSTMIKSNNFNKKTSVFSLLRKYKKIAKVSALIWLYNPLTMVIATRGNGDCISCLLILLSIYYLMKSNETLKLKDTKIVNVIQLQYLLAGIFHGIAIHFRLYPIAFSLSYYLFLSQYDSKNLNFFKFILISIKPNGKQISLIIGTILSLLCLTLLFYKIYDYEFLYQTYIYHLKRNDVKHNFSLYFYMQYLHVNRQSSINLIEKLLKFLPQLIILLITTFHFGKSIKTFTFSIFIQSFILVIYNPVITSQYFIWFLATLPLCYKNLQDLSFNSIRLYCLLWFLTQGAWLLPAYLLEFKGWNTFGFIWIQSIIFFATNIFILKKIINNFNLSIFKIP